MGLTGQAGEAIFGETFHPDITKQITVRQELLANGLATEISPDVIKYQNSSTAWIKLVSSVDVISAARFTGTRLQDKWGPDKTSLATKYVLFGGQSGLGGSVRGGITLATGSSNSSYGWTKESGFRPMPGITSATISHVDNGTLVKSTIKIKAYSAEDMDAIDNLYLRLGYTVLLEWGHTIYADNDKKIIEINSTNTNSLEADFLKGGISYDTVLEKLRARRVSSKGNYDGALGKVVNFSWNLMEDGSYDITLELFSVGSIIESLHLGSGAQTPPADLQSQLDTDKAATDAYKTLIKASYRHTLGKFLSYVQYTLQYSNQTPPQTYGNSINFKTKTTVAGVSVAEKFPLLTADAKSGTSNTTAIGVSMKIPGGPGGDFQYYVRFGDLLQFIEKYYMLTDGKQSLTTINYQADSCITYAPGAPVVSSDPTICMVRNDLEVAIPPSSPQSKPIFKIQGNGEQLPIEPPYFQNAISSIEGTGRAMHIYLNLLFVLNTAESCIDPKTGKMPMHQVIDKICQGINKALGYSCELTPFYSDITNTYKIINKKVYNDIPKLAKAYDGANDSKAKFLIYGYGKSTTNGTTDGGTFVRKLSLQTRLDKEVGNTITAGAAVQGITPGEESTAFSKWSEGLQDRIIPNKVGPTTPSTDDEEQKKQQEAREAEIITSWEQYMDTLALIENANVPSGNVAPGVLSFKWDPVRMETAPATYQEYIRYTAGLEARENLKDKKASYLFGWLPLNIQLTIKGLSGMKVLQTFDVDTNVLPSNYPTTLETIVAGLSHEINADGWFTTIRTFATFKAVPTRRKRSSGGIGKEKIELPSGKTSPGVGGTCPALKKATPTPPPTIPLSRGDQEQAMKAAITYYRTSHETKGACPKGTYNIAYLYKKYYAEIKSGKTKQITIPQKPYKTLASGLSPKTSDYQNNIQALGYTREDILTGAQKQTIQSVINSTTFNIGDVIAYWSSTWDTRYPQNDGDNNSFYLYGHTQIYRGPNIGNIPFTVINKQPKKVPYAKGNWETDVPNNYGTGFVYGPKYSQCWNLIIFRFKP